MVDVIDCAYKVWFTDIPPSSNVGEIELEYIIVFICALPNSIVGDIAVGVMEGKSIKEESPCWKGYKQVGMKDKGGKQVPNCVPA